MPVRRPRRGRAPSINRESITKAVERLGRRGVLTMNAVADELGVDLTTLYRHVGGVEELRRVWATVVAPVAESWPSPSGHTWESWLRAVARHLYEALRDHPELLEHTGSALDPELESLEMVARVLVEFGFEPRAALWAYWFLVNNLIGLVQQELQTEAEFKRGQPNYLRILEKVATDRTGRLSTLMSLDLRPSEFTAGQPLDRYLTYAIAGIRSQPGAPAPREEPDR